MQSPARIGQISVAKIIPCHHVVYLMCVLCSRCGCLNQRQPSISSPYVYASDLGRCPAAYAAMGLDVVVVYYGNAEYQRLFFIYAAGGSEAARKFSVEALLFVGIAKEVP